MWHYLSAAGCHRTSGTSASFTHLRNQSQETSYSLSNHFKMNTNRTNATQSQEPRHWMVSTLYSAVLCPCNCSLWPTWYKIVRSLKSILAGLATLHPCTMGFNKELFSKRSLQDLGQSPAKQLTLQPVLTGTVNTCHEGLGCRNESGGEVSFILWAGKETATGT